MNFRFNVLRITHDDLIWIIGSIIIISFMYFSLFLGERFLFPKDGRDKVSLP